MSKAKHRVIIGSSHAGITALERLRAIDPESPITIVSEETGVPYSPTSLPAFVAGEVKEENLGLRDTGMYKRSNVTPSLGRRVEGLDARNRSLLFSDGGKLRYDQVLIATGSRAAIPPIPGLRSEDVLVLRTLDDAIRLSELCKRSREAIVIGAGLVGMEVAASMKKRGLKVTMVELLGQVLPLYFDRDASSMIERTYRENDIEVITGARVQTVERTDKHMRLKLLSGETLESDFVLVATGVKPNVEFLAESGIAVAEGILVDRQMQTSDPAVYAAGDVVRGPDFFSDGKVMTPTVLNAVRQAQVAGDNMAGKESSFEGGITVNIFNYFQNVAISIGDCLDGEGREVLKKVDRKKRTFKKLVIRDGKLLGCAVVNQKLEAGLARKVILDGHGVDEVRRCFHDDIAGAFRRTVIRESGYEMEQKRRIW